MNSHLERAGVALLEKADSILNAHRRHLEFNREIMLQTCEELGLALLFGKPSGFFGLVNTGHLKRSSAEVGLDLVADFNLGIMPASDFGPFTPTYIRVNFAASKADLTETLNRIYLYLESQK